MSAPGIDYAATASQVAELSARLLREPQDAAARAGLERCAAALGLRGCVAPAAEPPRVSIVVLAKDQLDHTRRCLSALRRTVPPGMAEIILVDNGSRDGTRAWAEAQPDLRLIANPENRGFGPANNQAAATARGEFLLFLNNDTEPQPGWLEALLQEVAADPQIGAVGARLVTREGLLLEAGAVLNLDGTVTNRGRETFQSAHSYAPALDVDYTSACCLLVRRQAFEAVRGYDPLYAPAYYEDVDLCVALREAGWRVRVAPEAWIVHAESVTAKAVTGSEKKRLKLQKAAQRKFLDKWGDRFLLPADGPLAEVRRPLLPAPIRVAILSPYHGPDCLWGEAMISDNLREAFEWRPDVGEVRIFSYATAGELATFRPDLLFSFTAWRQPLDLPHAVSLFYVVNYTHEFMPAGQALTWEDALRLEADLYAANSPAAVARFAEHKPAHLLHMAANPRVHSPQAARPEYRAQVAYLGSYNPGTKGHEVFDRYVLPATGFDLALWGEMWERSPEVLRRHWRGVLPIPDIAALYSSVDVALGFQAGSQAAAGMVNNRVFEVLACGSLLLSDRIPAIEQMFGDCAVFSDGYADTRDKLAHYLEHPEERAALTRRAREKILTAHTYDHRAREILEMYAEHQKARGRL
jgi:GT2 family glycosyltransferase